MRQENSARRHCAREPLNEICVTGFRVRGWDGAGMSEVSEVARRLKELREQAGLTMRAVSDSLGWSLTRYQHYEDRYKRKYLPFELARALEEMFVRQGVPAGAVLQ